MCACCAPATFPVWSFAPGSRPCCPSSKAAIMRLDPIVDRAEYNAFVHLSASQDSVDTSTLLEQLRASGKSCSACDRRAHRETSVSSTGRSGPTRKSPRQTSSPSVPMRLCSTSEGFSHPRRIAVRRSSRCSTTCGCAARSDGRCCPLCARGFFFGRPHIFPSSSTRRTTSCSPELTGTLRYRGARAHHPDRRRRSQVRLVDAVVDPATLESASRRDLPMRTNLGLMKMKFARRPSRTGVSLRVRAGLAPRTCRDLSAGSGAARGRFRPPRRCGAHARALHPRGWGGRSGAHSGVVRGGAWRRGLPLSRVEPARLRGAGCCRFAGGVATLTS